MTPTVLALRIGLSRLDLINLYLKCGVRRVHLYDIDPIHFV